MRYALKLIIIRYGRQNFPIFEIGVTNSTLIISFDINFACKFPKKNVNLKSRYAATKNLFDMKFRS